MHPFTIEQLTYAHARDLKARAAREALATSGTGASRSKLAPLSRLSTRLRCRRDAAPPLALVVPLASARRHAAMPPWRRSVRRPSSMSRPL
jgi:hypothetical protein